MFFKYSLTAGVFALDIGGEYSPTSFLFHQLTPEISVVKWYLYSLDLINLGAFDGNGFFETSINCNTSFSSKSVSRKKLIHSYTIAIKHSTDNTEIPILHALFYCIFLIKSYIRNKVYY